MPPPQQRGEKRPATPTGSAPAGPSSKRPCRAKENLGEGSQSAADDDDDDEDEVAVEAARDAEEESSNEGENSVLGGADDPDVEAVRRELVGRLAALPAKPGDEKWWESWIAMGKEMCNLN